MHLLYHSNNFLKAPWKSSCVSMSMTFITASFIPSIVSVRQPLSWGNNQKSQGQSLDYREAEQLSWCPSWSNSLWQGWSCSLVHCPGRNATDLISRVLASCNGISSWTPLKPQYSNPNPNPLANQLWCIDFLTPPTPLIIPHRLRAFPWISYATQKLLLNSCKMVEKQSEAFHMFLWPFFPTLKQNVYWHIVLLKCSHIQIAFLKFTSCDNQALVGCIPIAAVAVHLNLKS